MSSKPKQFIWWRRRAAEMDLGPQGRFISPERARALIAAGIIGIISWVAFYWTMGSHRIEQLDEFVSYLKGEDLYRKYEVSNITWNCDELRQQFAETYIVPRPDRMAHDGRTLVFRRTGLDQKHFEAWVESTDEKLAFGRIRKVENEASLLPAMMVRLFTRFRFESGELSHTLKNDFSNKCRS